MDFDTNQSMNQNTYQSNTSQHQQTPPTVCPRCHNVANGRFCLYCGLDLAMYQAQYQNPYNSYQYSYNTNYGYYSSQFQPAVKSKRVVVWPFIVGGALVIIAIITAAIIFINFIIKGNKPYNYNEYGNYNNYEEGILPNGISKQELNQIKTGMSYAHVSAIIGGDGELVDQGTTPLDEKYYTYHWYGENNPNASVYITFVNDKVSDIVNNGV